MDLKIETLMSIRSGLFWEKLACYSHLLTLVQLITNGAVVHYVWWRVMAIESVLNILLKCKVVMTALYFNLKKLREGLVNSRCAAPPVWAASQKNGWVPRPIFLAYTISVQVKFRGFSPTCWQQILLALQLIINSLIRLEFLKFILKTIFLQLIQ